MTTSESSEWHRRRSNNYRQSDELTGSQTPSPPLMPNHHNTSPLHGQGGQEWTDHGGQVCGTRRAVNGPELLTPAGKRLVSKNGPEPMDLRFCLCLICLATGSNDLPTSPCVINLLESFKEYQHD